MMSYFTFQFQVLEIKMSQLFPIFRPQDSTLETYKSRSEKFLALFRNHEYGLVGQDYLLKSAIL